MLAQQGLGKYCDPEFVRTTYKEMAEAMEMTGPEFDRAAHQILRTESMRQSESERTAVPPLAPARHHRPPLKPQQHVTHSSSESDTDTPISHSTKL